MGGGDRPEMQDRDELEELSTSEEPDMHARLITPFAHLKTRAGALSELPGGFQPKMPGRRADLASVPRNASDKKMDDSYRVHIMYFFTVCGRTTRVCAWGTHGSAELWSNVHLC